MPSLPTKEELQKLVEQVEALHNRIPEGTFVREFTLDALCSLNGAMSHLPESVSRTGKEEGRTKHHTTSEQP